MVLRSVTWTWDRAVGIAAGGAAGAALRWWLVEAAGDDAFPWPVLIVNVAGSFLLGILLAEEPDHPRARVALHDLGAIGFCGGLTTFSTFALEVSLQMDRGEVLAAVSYVLASVLGSIAAIVFGAALLRRVGALRSPLEEQP